MNLCPYATQCRRAEECNSPHPEPTRRECLLPISKDWTWPELAAPASDPESIALQVPAVDPDLLARIDAVLAEPTDRAPSPKVEARREPIQGGLF